MKYSSALYSAAAATSSQRRRSMTLITGFARGIGLPKAIALLVLLLLGSLLSGCISQAPAPKPKVVQPLPTVAAKPAPPTVEQRVSLLLRQAERALSADRLLLPAGDNAYDRYQAVLKLQPNNAQAKTGLQVISMRYIDMGRTALRHSRVSDARVYAQRAKRVYGDNPLLRELEQALAEAEQHQRVAALAVDPSPAAHTKQGSAPKSAQASADNEYALNPAALSKRGDEIQAVLAKVAQRVKVSDEVLLIVARNDEEGRWLYQAMKKAAEGHRIRGDIKVGSPPKIVVYPPI
jgi:hypothetical protein